MSDKRILPPYQIVGGTGTKSVSGTMTGTATINSIATNISNLDNVSIQISWTGTPTGTISVLSSVDGTNYVTVMSTSDIGQPAGVAGGYLISLNQMPFPWVRLQYVNASGSGTLSAWISGKEIS
jgi:hypothetical protein